MDYDVIVVGAGPAGSTAAFYLARQGRRVLLVDKCGFPRDKPCGGGIPPGTLKLVEKLGMSLPLDPARCYPINSLRLTTPQGRVVAIRIKPKEKQNGFYIISREYFDWCLQQCAVKAGAEFRQARVTGPIIEKGRTAGVRAMDNGRQQEFRARATVGADGVNSAMAGGLGAVRPRRCDQVIAVRGYLEGFETRAHTIEIHYDRALLPCYAWIFPTADGQANVGLGMLKNRYRDQNASLKSRLEGWLKTGDRGARLGPGGKLTGLAAWPIALAPSKYIRRFFNGALLAGDAAALADPFSGEGIRNAIISGQVAGQVLEEALGRDDVSAAGLQVYQQRVWRHLGGVTRRSQTLQWILRRVPRWLEVLTEVTLANNLLLLGALSAFSTDFSFTAVRRGLPVRSNLL